MPDPVAEARAARARLRGLELVRPAEVGHMVTAPDGVHKRFVVDYILDGVHRDPSYGLPGARHTSVGFPGEWT